MEDTKIMNIFIDYLDYIRAGQLMEGCLGRKDEGAEVALAAVLTINKILGGSKNEEI